jgi:hypothetical protein
MWVIMESLWLHLWFTSPQAITGHIQLNMILKRTDYGVWSK